MKILGFVLVVAVITTTVAFPTPQEVKPVSETKQQEQHVPMVQKIEIHVEVKAIPSDTKIPAMVTVTEVKEHLEKSTEAIKSVDADKVFEVVKSPDVKSSESVESSEHVRSVEVAKPVDPVMPFEDTKDTEAFKKAPNVDDSTTKTTDVKQETQVKGEIDQLVEATSQPKAAILETPVVKSVESEIKNVVTEAATAKPVLVEAKVAKTVKPQTNDDSDEDKSSEEVSTTEMVQKMTGVPVRSSPVITFDEAVKETTMGTIKEQETTVMPQVQADKVPKVHKQEKVDTEVKLQPEVKSSLNEKVVPIVEDLPVVKQSVETEPLYRTIPVAVVHDEPLKEEIKEVTVKALETVEVSEQKKETIPALIPTEAATVKADEEKPIVKAKTDTTTVGEVQKEDAPSVKEIATVKTVADVKTLEAFAAKTVEIKSEKAEEPNVLVVSAIKAVDVKELAPTAQTTPELVQETAVEGIKAAKEEGSSTKAVKSESEKAEKQAEDSSVSSSAALKLTEDVTKTSEVAEKSEEVKTDESTTTTTTTTTAAPVKVEGKKGKKKLPGSNKKQNTI